MIHDVTGVGQIVSPLQQAFADRFGEENAVRLMNCAILHNNEVHGDARDNDLFQWVLAITIGHQCFEIDRYRHHHGFGEDFASFEEIKQWIYNEADLAHYDGDIDYLALFIGKYDQFVKREEP